MNPSITIQGRKVVVTDGNKRIIYSLNPDFTDNAQRVYRVEEDVTNIPVVDNVSGQQIGSIEEDDGQTITRPPLDTAIGEISRFVPDFGGYTDQDIRGVLADK